MEKKTYEYKDSSVELAIEKGLKELGIKRIDAEIKIKSSGGLIKKACVEIIPNEGVEVKEPSEVIEEQKEEAVKSEPKEEATPKEHKVEKTAKEEKVVKEEKKAREPKSEKAAKEEKALKEEKKTKVAKEEIDEEDIGEENKAVLKNPASEEDVNLAIERAEEFLNAISEIMNIGSEIELDKGYDGIKVKFTGGEIARVIGYRGETLDAIQTLTACVANQETQGFVRIQIDAGDYREKRAESLVRLAKNLASKCVKTRRSQKLEPMNAYERRIIHITLKEHPQVETESIGTGSQKPVVIRLKASERKKNNESVEESQEIEYGTSDRFKRKGASKMRRFGSKDRRF